MPFQDRKDEFAEARSAMVESQLRPQGIADPLILEAMGSTPRERFVPETAQSLAYSDRAVPLGDGAWLMAPAALGLLLQSLEPAPGERALVVGTGSGYAVALLRAIGVDAIEATLGEGDLPAGIFELILIDGAVEKVPDAVIAQLAVGGRLAAAVSDRGVTRLMVGVQSGGGFGLRSIGDAAVPLLPGLERPRAFVF